MQTQIVGVNWKFTTKNVTARTRNSPQTEQSDSAHLTTNSSVSDVSSQITSNSTVVPTNNTNTTNVDLDSSITLLADSEVVIRPDQQQARCTSSVSSKAPFPVDSRFPLLFNNSIDNIVSDTLQLCQQTVSAVQNTVSAAFTSNIASTFTLQTAMNAMTAEHKCHRQNLTALQPLLKTCQLTAPFSFNNPGYGRFGVPASSVSCVDMVSPDIRISIITTMNLPSHKKMERCRWTFI